MGFMKKALGQITPALPRNRQPLDPDYMPETVVCALCKESDQLSVSEDDTVYCSRCAWRTELSNGREAVHICPHCWKSADRIAYHCRHCNRVHPDKR